MVCGKVCHCSAANKVHQFDILRSDVASLSSLSMTSRSALMVSTSSINWVNCCTTGDPLREAMGLDDGSALSMSAWQKSAWHEGWKAKQKLRNILRWLAATLQNQQLVLWFMCTFYFPLLSSSVTEWLSSRYVSLTVITVRVTDCHPSTCHWLSSQYVSLTVIPVCVTDCHHSTCHWLSSQYVSLTVITVRVTDCHHSMCHRLPSR